MTSLFSKKTVITLLLVLGLLVSGIKANGQLTPVIKSISPTVGSTMGGTLLTLQISAFETTDINDIVVTVGGFPCLFEGSLYDPEKDAPGITNTELKCVTTEADELDSNDKGRLVKVHIRTKGWATYESAESNYEFNYLKAATPTLWSISAHSGSPGEILKFRINTAQGHSGCPTIFLGQDYWNDD